MKKITPFLWFNNNVEEAMNFYVSIFKNSKIISVSRQTEDGPVLTATFELDGQKFMALNGGPHFTFNEAISMFVNCETQDEVDELWEKLSDGGEIQQCGWLKDKYGLSWQIIRGMGRSWNAREARICRPCSTGNCRAALSSASVWNGAPTRTAATPGTPTA